MRRNNRNGAVLVTAFERRVLLHRELQDVFLIMACPMRILANVLARNGMLMNGEEFGRHDRMGDASKSTAQLGRVSVALLPSAFDWNLLRDLTLFVRIDVQLG